MHPDSIKIPRTCDTCGNTFWIPKRRLRYAACRFCSKKCHHAYRARTPEERFWQYVVKTNACWLWTGALNRRGYGNITIERKRWFAHRFSYVIARGPIPDGLEVCHACDNPACVNPEHLFVATHAENMADMAAKNRAGKQSHLPQGSSHHKAKLTEADIPIIRQMVTDGVSQRAVARQFGMSQAVIWRIVHRTLWRHVK